MYPKLEIALAVVLAVCFGLALATGMFTKLLTPPPTAAASQHP